MLTPAPAAPRARRHRAAGRRGRRNKDGGRGRKRQAWREAERERSQMITIRISNLKAIPAARGARRAQFINIFE
ncbi:hypothetical protein CBM2592_B20103 [Cupriavidus taiwanensis]|nr:hypothetical protein CBM2588_B20101 [Cupriavidus taiwanensis]SOY69965.1 hypothetical protein CBM2592_B20103 [Cupriavidus taiwanensis]SOY92321.1 hypothetical protein CBM2591_B10394 [Cupriavidus taiwanensis]SOZ74087.1 hypothetical protein CBM2617_B30076 [Cupriavidus taiwanensis]SOZ87978.1 hypothetical protein CBM2618_B30075 [Cupriavidus taiwanensis]